LARSETWIRSGEDGEKVIDQLHGAPPGLPIRLEAEDSGI
jgi:hypothetical protein